MKNYRCKCGKVTAFGTDVPTDDIGCLDCHTTLSTHPQYHRPFGTKHFFLNGVQHFERQDSTRLTGATVRCKLLPEQSGYTLHRENDAMTVVNDGDELKWGWRFCAIPRCSA